MLPDVEQSALTLLQYGAVGAIAVLAILALGYVTRRYISHLERNEQRQAETLDRIGGVLGLFGGQVADLERSVRDHRSEDRTRHAEVISALRERRGA